MRRGTTIAQLAAHGGVLDLLAVPKRRSFPATRTQPAPQPATLTLPAIPAAPARRARTLACQQGAAARAAHTEPAGRGNTCGHLADTHTDVPDKQQSPERDAVRSGAESHRVSARAVAQGRHASRERATASTEACNNKNDTNHCLVYGCDAERFDTLLPGYVSRPHPSPVNRLLQAPAQADNACTPEHAPRCKRALRFSDHPAATQHRIESSPLRAGQQTAAPRTTSPRPVAKASGLCGYGAVELANSVALPSSSPEQHLLSVSAPTTGNLFASLQAELSAGAVCSAGASAEVPEISGNVAITEAAAAAAHEHTAAAPPSQCERGNKASIHDAPSPHDSSAWPEAAWKANVAASTEEALCAMPLPAGVQLYRRLYSALCALHAWLLSRYVQVRDHCCTFCH